MANEKRFEEHNLKVSCLYPEVHDRLKKTDISCSTSEAILNFVCHAKQWKRHFVIRNA